MANWRLRQLSRGWPADRVRGGDSDESPLRRSCVAVVVWSFPLLLAFATAQAQTDSGVEANREYAIKAAYLYNFGRYVQWPAESFAEDGSPFVIAVLGEDPFGPLLDEVAISKRIEGRPIVIRRFSSVAELAPCHILFIAAAAEAERKAAAIVAAQRSPILLVGEEPGFAQHGGIINFVIEEDKVRFEINAEAARRNALKISAKLLSLGKTAGE